MKPYGYGSLLNGIDACNHARSSQQRLLYSTQNNSSAHILPRSNVSPRSYHTHYYLIQGTNDRITPVAGDQLHQSHLFRLREKKNRKEKCALTLSLVICYHASLAVLVRVWIDFSNLQLQSHLNLILLLKECQMQNWTTRHGYIDPRFSQLTLVQAKKIISLSWTTVIHMTSIA